jgi:hypothetical protein
MVSSHFLSFLLRLSMISHVIRQECPWIYLNTGSLASLPPVLSFSIWFILTDMFFLGFHGRRQRVRAPGRQLACVPPDGVVRVKLAARRNVASLPPLSLLSPRHPALIHVASVVVTKHPGLLTSSRDGVAPRATTCACPTAGGRACPLDG